MTLQQRQILRALLHGPMTTGQCWETLRICTLSQRAGELERLGLVTRRHVPALSSGGQPTRVVEAALTDKGRQVAHELTAGNAAGTESLDSDAPSQAGGAPTPPAAAPATILEAGEKSEGGEVLIRAGGRGEPHAPPAWAEPRNPRTETYRRRFSKGAENE